MSVEVGGASLRQKIDDICEAKKLSFQVETALNKNSENIEPADWSYLLSAIDNALARGIDRIVLTHGTDTLAFSSTAVDLFFGSRPAKVCLTGSFHSIDESDNDVELNLSAAFRTLVSDRVPSGVYVAFRRDELNRVALIHRARDLKPMDFDEVGFTSLWGAPYGKYYHSGANRLDIQETTLRPMPTLADKAIPSGESLRQAAGRIVMLGVYPGIDFTSIRIDSRVQYVVLNLYHSGTASAENSIDGVLRFVEETSKSKPVFLSTFPSMLLERPYRSTEKLVQAGGTLIGNIQTHQLYTYLCCGLAQDRGAAELVGGLECCLPKIT